MGHFSPGHVGHQVTLDLLRFVILSNIAVTDNTGNCSIRNY